MSDTLKPCPFCGGDADISHDHTVEESHAYGCRNCSLWFDTFNSDDAIAAWNTRATPEAETRGVRVKALVWNHYDFNSWSGKGSTDSYGIDLIKDEYHMDGDKFPSLEAAKAAAQADYTARILSALEPAPVQGWQDGHAAEVMLRHYANEVRPHAEARGDSRADVREVVLAKVARVFDEAWPAPQDGGQADG